MDENLSMTLTSNNCTTQYIFFLIVELKSKLLNALHILKIWETLFLLKLLSACVGIWTEAHKICKPWVLMNQILPRCFCSYGLRLNKSNHRVKQVDISEPTDIKQSISMNQFYSIQTLIFVRDFFVFPYSIIIQYFQYFQACYSNKWKAWHLCSILNLLKII